MVTDPYDVLRPGGSVPSAQFNSRETSPIRPLGAQPIVAIVATGAYTLADALLTGMFLWLQSGSYPLATAEAITSLGLVVLIVSGIGAYVALCIWMQAVRNRLSEARYDVPPVWKIWAGWLIPFYALVAPFNVMKGLRVRVLWGSDKLVNVWWSTFLVSSFIARYSSAGAFGGEANVLLPILSSILLVGSFAALVVVIRSTSASLEPRQTLWHA